MDSFNENATNSTNIKQDLPIIELRFLIPSRVAGTIIGKNGENIKNLRRLYMARIHITDSNGPERVLSVEADLDSILEVLRESLDKIELPSSGSGDIKAHSHEIDLRMLINQSLVGALIGRGGSRISDLREKCDLKVLKIYQNVCPESTDRVIQMVGSIIPIIDCIGKAIFLCKDTPVKEPKINYDPRNFDASISDLYGGWSPNTAININRTLAFSKSESIKATKRPHNDDPFDLKFINSFDNNPHMPMSNPRKSTEDPKSLKDCQQTLQLPNNLIGAIIGPGGSRIRQIRLDSEAAISISDPDRMSAERTITINGSVDSVLKAQDLINAYIDRYGK